MEDEHGEETLRRLEAERLDGRWFPTRTQRRTQEMFDDSPAKCAARRQALEDEVARVRDRKKGD